MLERTKAVLCILARITYIFSAEYPWEQLNFSFLHCWENTSWCLTQGAGVSCLAEVICIITLMRSRRAPRNPSSPGRQSREDTFRWQSCFFSSGCEQLCLRHHLEENWDSVKLISQIKRLGVNDLWVINMHVYKVTVPMASVLGFAKVSPAHFLLLFSRLFHAFP